MIKLKVDKKYLLNTKEIVHCVFKSNNAGFPFLMVFENSYKTLWFKENGHAAFDYWVIGEVNGYSNSIQR